MKIDSVTLQNYRNAETVQFEPGEGVNVIYGANAQGKTNIIEAMWLFTGCKSFRGARDNELIKFGADTAKLSLAFTDSSRSHYAELTLGAQKQAFLNGVALESPAEFIGRFYAVIFSPAHLALIQDGPLFRRRFLDTALCELRPRYAEYLSRYRHTLVQRNALLKDLYMSAELYDVLDNYDDVLAHCAAAVVYERIGYTRLLSEYCKEIYGGISEGTEDFSVVYSRDTEGERKPPEELYREEAERLKAARKNDVLFKTTTVGPHRDDLDIRLNGVSARSYGSQGQQRSCALVLKLGESEIIKRATGETPVMLLDDVMSELDEKRQDYVLNHIDNRQVFLTCCDPSQVLRLCKGQSFLVQNGTLKAEEP